MTGRQLSYVSTCQIHSSYQLQRAEEEMNQLGRARILYVFLQFGLQGEQRQIHGEKVMKGGGWTRGG